MLYLLGVSQLYIMKNTYPSNDKLNIETNLQPIESCTVYNSLGQEIYCGAFLPTIDVSNFLSGIYFITI